MDTDFIETLQRGIAVVGGIGLLGFYSRTLIKNTGFIVVSSLLLPTFRKMVNQLARLIIYSIRNM